MPITSRYLIVVFVLLYFLCGSSRKYYSHPIPRSPFYPNFTITFDYNTTEFLQRPGVQGQSPKIITWMVPTRYLPPLPEPVRLRFCPELPCLMTTNRTYQQQSMALVWNGQIMEEVAPPARAHPDQVLLLIRRAKGGESKVVLSRMGMGGTGLWGGMGVVFSLFFVQAKHRTTRECGFSECWVKVHGQRKIFHSSLKHHFSLVPISKQSDANIWYTF